MPRKRLPKVSYAAQKPRLMHKGKYLRLVRKGTWEFIERCNCDGIAIIVPVKEDGTLIFVSQPRVPVARHVVEFPAGLIGDLRPRNARKESMAAAARRELLEETGYRARRIRFLTTGPAASGSSTVLITFFLATGLTRVGPGGGDASENITVFEVPLARADAWLTGMRARGYWVDPKVYTGLYFLKNYNRSIIFPSVKTYPRKKAKLKE